MRIDQIAAWMLMQWRRWCRRTSCVPAAVTCQTFPVVILRTTRRSRAYRSWLMSLLFVMSSMSAAAVWAAPKSAQPAAAEAPQERVEHKSVTGKLVASTKRMLSVEYSTTDEASYELALGYAPETKFVHAKNLADLAPGDTVKVDYDQVLRPEGDKGEWIVRKMTATTIALVRRAPTTKLTSREAESNASAQ